jgi:16S rRNA processing protein RimM
MAAACGAGWSILMTGIMVLLGRITGAHGLKGEVKIAAFTAQPEDISAYGALTNADGTRKFQIASLRGTSGGAVIARLRGVSTREEAEQLRGTDLFVSREALPEPEASDEFYHSDLIGLEAISPDGETIGEVVAVYNFGAGDLLEVRFSKERYPELIPFESAHAPHVDVPGRRIMIVRPIYQQGEGPESE